MNATSRLRLVALILAVAAALASAGQALTLPFRTHFGADPVGLPPGVGGLGQPSALNAPAGSSITVVSSLLGLDAQPVELDSPNGEATWLGWYPTPVVADLGVEIRFSVSFSSLYNGYFFDTSGPSGVQLRLRTNAAGELYLTNGCASTTLGTYTPGTPVAVVLLFAPPASYWVITDGENDGFDDNTPVEGESCQPGNLTALYAYAWHSGAPAPALVAFDDFSVEWMPIFVDDFETGGTTRWATDLP